MRWNRRRPPASQPRRAAAVVEMAIILPVFLLIVMGIVEFGRAMMVGQLLTNGARHGARRAAIDGSTNGSVEEDVKTFLTGALNVPDDAIDVQIYVDPAPGNEDPNDNLAAAESRDLVQVKITVPFDRVAYVAGNFLSGQSLEGSCSMRRE